MPNNDTTKRLERWKLADLKPHPNQAGLFHAAAHDPGDKELAESMRLNGLQFPVEILPDGTIVCGHRRTRAARTLGWAEIDVWVRDDLAGDQAAAERRLIEDNVLRRQLGELDLARCYRRLRELARNVPRAERREYQKGDMRDVIAKKLGVAGRNLDRYLRVLGAPPAVQRAVERKELSLQDGGAVAVMAKERKEEVARRIEAGEKARDVVREFFPKKAATHRKVYRAQSAFDRSLDAGLQDLGHRVGEVKSITPKQAELYRAAMVMIGKILEQSQVLDDSPEACAARLAAKIAGLEECAG